MLRLVSDMLDSNKNWEGRYFFVKGWVGYAIWRNGIQSLTALITIRELLRIQV